MEQIEASKRVYTVTEIQDMLGIGKNQAYSLIKRQEFPVRKCGKKLLEQEYKMRQLEELNAAIESSGMTIEEAIKKFKK